MYQTHVNHEITVPVGDTGYVKVHVQYSAGDNPADIERAIDDANALAVQYVTVHQADPPTDG